MMGGIEPRPAHYVKNMFVYALLYTIFSFQSCEEELGEEELEVKVTAHMQPLNHAATWNAG